MKFSESLSALLVIDDVPEFNKVFVTVSNDFVEIYSPSQEKTYTWASDSGVAVSAFINKSDDDLMSGEFELPRYIVDKARLSKVIVGAINELRGKYSLEQEFVDALIGVNWSRYVTEDMRIKCPFLIDIEDFKKTKLDQLNVPLHENPEYMALKDLVGVVKVAIQTSRYCQCVQESSERNSC
ncbi:hypothetical protein [Vibrio sp. D431a]|uniref:hypothetical protein n=1 Tax=Vibrio sp. D431a TaxID=2837388 RepID=UPI002556096B|nr:hypothetical protein [Vibrio sp. D431a]MDK9790080.1 hypothetical protein [Vibrio sp. D431a]